MFTDCMYNFFKRLERGYTQDAEQYIKRKRSCMSAFPNQPRRELKYLLRILSCSEVLWKTVLSIRCIFSIETNIN